MLSTGKKHFKRTTLATVLRTNSREAEVGDPLKGCCNKGFKQKIMMACGGVGSRAPGTSQILDLF